MKLLHVASGFPPAIGGVETLVADLATWQATDGHDVRVVSGTGEGIGCQSRDRGVSVRRLPFIDALARRDMAQIAELRRDLFAAAAESDIDIIHFHPVAAEMFFMNDLARATGLPKIATIHVDPVWMPPVYRRNLHGFLQRMDVLAAVSRPLLHDVAGLFPDLADKLHLVDNGVALRDPLPVAIEPDAFLYLGRLAAEKGVDIVLHALAHCVARGARPRLTIAGDGPERAALEHLVRTLALDDRVTFLGSIHREAVPSTIARHAALVVPSRWREPFGLVVLEAAMAGRPALVAPLGALADLVEPGVTGLHVAPNDPHDLAAAMLQILGAPDQADRLGCAAAAKVRSSWSIARCGAQYGALYAVAINLKA